MESKEFEIKPGTIYRCQDRLDPRTGKRNPIFDKYVVLDPLGGGVIASNWLDETKEQPELAIGGTHTDEDVTEIIGEMTVEEVLEAIRNKGWYSAQVEEEIRKCFSVSPRKITVKK